MRFLRWWLRLVRLFVQPSGDPGPWMPRWWWRLWVRATYWPVPCEDCEGTGLCKHPNPSFPHSCCGDCERVKVPRASVPVDFNGVKYENEDQVLVGCGVMYVRPWTPLRQERRPKL